MGLGLRHWGFGPGSVNCPVKFEEFVRRVKIEKI